MALTHKQRDFARNIANGMGQSAAARAAGYAHGSPNALAVTARRTLALPEVQRAAHTERERILCGGLAHKALRCLESIIDSDTAPAAAKFAASRWVLEAGGHGIESRRLALRAGDDSERSPSQLTAADLERLVIKSIAEVDRLSAIDAEAYPQTDGADSGGCGY